MKIKLLFIFCWFALATSAQQEGIIVSGNVRDGSGDTPLPFENVVLRSLPDSSFVTGAVTDEAGSFQFSPVKSGDYLLQIRSYGFQPKLLPLFVGDNSPYLDLGKIEMESILQEVGEVKVTAKQDAVSGKLDKQVYDLGDNISQTGGSVTAAMKNLPGVTIEDGVVKLRGSDQIIILIDGKQTALTGFGNQKGLENLPASAVEKIEIIQNPSSKYDSNGSAGIINIILKKEQKEGLNGTVSMNGGLGALWIKKANLPTIRSQYQYTPKINPSLSLNYRKKKMNLFFDANYLYTHTLNKNEFVTRTYDDGTVIQQQTMRNRNTSFVTARAGMDLQLSERDQFTIYGFIGSEKILDNGDEPFFNADLSSRYRLWTFLEDELKTTATGTINYAHKFKQAGHQLEATGQYNFHRENEQYFFDNQYDTYTGRDSFKLLSDENVIDFKLDYTKPLKQGKLESGVYFRDRFIPTNMQFKPGLNSVLDSSAGGWARYEEYIPAAYLNYSYQNRKIDLDAGVRGEYAQINYLVNPNHPVYKSDGYTYFQPFPSVRFGYRLTDRNKITISASRRVNRPNEVDIRIFPKYDDAEIIKVGNPELGPQFTDVAELGFKSSFKQSYIYAAFFARRTNGTITRIAYNQPGSTLIYNVTHNTGLSENIGGELIFNKNFGKKFTLNLNGTYYYNQFDAFTVINKYPVTDTISIAKNSTYSGTFKGNFQIHLKKGEIQVLGVYYAPDVIPQGRIESRFSLDIGFEYKIQSNKGRLFINATDLLNTMNIRQTIIGDGFTYTSKNYYETQVVRIGYRYSF